jgi:hypothetical protein
MLNAVSTSSYVAYAVGIPLMAIIFFAVIEAAMSRIGLWTSLSNAGLDLCQVSIGIVGATFIDVPSGHGSLFVLFFALILAGSAMLVEKRATDMGIELQSTKATCILGFGIVAMVTPAAMILLSGAR